MNKRQRRKTGTGEFAHPYAKEWAGSGYIKTASGTVAHVTGSKDMFNDPKTMAMLLTVIERAYSEPCPK